MRKERYAKNLAVHQVNSIELMTNYVLGRCIVAEQQNGEGRAQYGACVIKRLAAALTIEFGRGYSRETLKNCGRFYLQYRDRVDESLFNRFAIEKSHTMLGHFEKNSPFSLTWSHYLILMRIKNPGERRFYEMEAAKSRWNVRTLQCQYASSLYERLLISSDKKKVMELSITPPRSVIRARTACEGSSRMRWA